MARQRKQQQIPGTEPKTIPVLDEKAEAYRALVVERMELQAKEEAAKADLIQEVHTQVQKGNLVPPPKSDSDIVPIYKFTDSEGVNLVVKWGRKEGVKVNKAKEPGEAAQELDA